MNTDETMKKFEDLNAWKEGHKLVLMIYEATKKFPSDERFGLVSQMRRAAVSITSNIAEGFTRLSYAEKIRFYNFSHASITEIQNQLIISRDVGFISSSDYQEYFNQSVTVHKILTGLIKSTQLRS
jgi:four helix bundle protein